MDWTEARCKSADPEIFFPMKGGDAIIVKRRAKKICNDCCIQEACLDYAIRNNERFGIWGGMTRKERKKHERKMKQLRQR